MVRAGSLGWLALLLFCSFAMLVREMEGFEVISRVEGERERDGCLMRGRNLKMSGWTIEDRRYKMLESVGDGCSCAALLDGLGGGKEAKQW